MTAFWKVVNDGEVTVDKAIPTKRVGNFDLRELDTGTDNNVVLIFKLRGKKGSALKMANKTGTTTHPIPLDPTANNADTFNLDDTFTTPQLKFEVLEVELFSRTGNQLTITLDNPAGTRDITVSDVKILYHD